MTTPTPQDQPIPPHSRTLPGTHPPPQPPLHILLVEDEAAHAEAIRRAFEMAVPNAAIRVVGTLAAYRRAVADAAPAIALIDLNLPDGHANEVLTAPPEAGLFPVVVMTAYGSERIAVDALKAGALDYVVKSSEIFSAMPRTVDRALREWALLQEHKRMDQDLRETNVRLTEAIEELKRTQQQVIQQERMKALGQMASGIAHDFNNNLMPILGFSEFLISAPHRLADRTETLEILNLIRSAAGDARETVKRLQEFYRPDAELECAEVDIQAQLARVKELTLPAWKTQAEAHGKAIRVELDVQPLPRLMANESQLRETLVNLVLNAVDSMPEGGCISLIGGMRGQDWVAIQVRDTGAGMTEDVRQHCLEPFFTTKGKEGSGLGLAMCHGIVQRHGGKLEIESEIGKGTTVTILLPLRPSKSAQPVEPLDRGSAIRGIRVLVVDDHAQSLEFVGKCLEADGQTVFQASSAREALALFDAGSVDLVITDQAMPEMNGEQLAEAIKKKRPAVPVILLTGFGDRFRPGSPAPGGVDRVMEKPTTREKLRDAVGEVMGGTRG